MKNWTGIILFLTSLLLIACEANEIGTEIQPTEDKLSVKTDSFTSSFVLASVSVSSLALSSPSSNSLAPSSKPSFKLSNN